MKKKEIDNQEIDDVILFALSLKDEFIINNHARTYNKVIHNIIDQKLKEYIESKKVNKKLYI